MATMFPGGVESRYVGGAGAPMNPSDELAWRKYQDEQEAKRKQEWANAYAKNNAAVAAKNAALQPTPEQNLRATFDATYGPQIQRAFQESAVNSAPTNTVAGRARDWIVGQGGGATGGVIGQPGTDLTQYAIDKSKSVQPNLSMRPDQLQNTLNTMWRQQADPYQQAVGKMGGFMQLFHPTNVAGQSSRFIGRGKGQQEEEGGGAPAKGSSYTKQMFG